MHVSTDLATRNATGARDRGTSSRLTEIARSDERVTWLGIGLMLLVRLALSRHEIAYPGLQGDEMLFVNAATLRLPGLYETHVFHGIPLMVFPYIGALKSWIYDPIFAIFGNSPTTLRMPAVVIACAGLALIYPAVRDLVNKPVALLSLVALSFDNSIFWLTRNDVGPSSLEFFFKCAALFCIARYVLRPRARWVALLVVCLGLGVFNTLNFIWDVNVAAAVSVLVIALQRAKLRAHARELATWIAGMAIVYAGFGAYYLGYHIGSLIPVKNSGLAYLWPLFDQGTRAILSGTWFYAYALAPIGARNTIVTIILALFVVGAIASVASARLRSVAIAGMAIATLLTVAQILATPQATAGWHYVTIYPFVTIVAAYGVYAAASLLPRASRAVPVALVCTGVLWLVYSGLLMDKYFGAVERQTVNPAWSPAVYNLSHFVQSTPDHVFMADWGIFNPIFALHPSTRYTELAFALQSPAPAATVLTLRRWLSGPTFPGTNLFVTHAPGQLEFPDSTADLFKIMHGKLRLKTIIDGPGGKPVYDVYASTVPASS
jgi:Dolichyl-phosphate-mannose-protein mannosyltransferase